MRHIRHRTRADRRAVERRRVRNQTVARHAPIGRLETDHAAVGRRQPNRAARVGTDRAGGERKEKGNVTKTFNAKMKCQKIGEQHTK